MQCCTWSRCSPQVWDCPWWEGGHWHFPKGLQRLPWAYSQILCCSFTWLELPVYHSDFL